MQVIINCLVQSQHLAKHGHSCLKDCAWCANIWKEFYIILLWKVRIIIVSKCTLSVTFDYFVLVTSLPNLHLVQGLLAQ